MKKYIKKTLTGLALIASLANCGTLIDGSQRPSNPEIENATGENVGSISYSPLKLTLYQRTNSQVQVDTQEAESRTSLEGMLPQNQTPTPTQSITPSPSPSLTPTPIPTIEPTPSPSVSATPILPEDSIHCEDGKINFIWYGGMQEPFSGRFYRDTFHKIVEKYNDRLNITFHHFPLSYNDYDHSTAQASECARDQNKFWQFLDLVYHNQENLDRENLVNYASELGLEVDIFIACLENGEKFQLVENQRQEAIALGLNGVPSFAIEDNYITGNLPQSEFERQIENNLAEFCEDYNLQCGRKLEASDMFRLGGTLFSYVKSEGIESETRDTNERPHIRINNLRSYEHRILPVEERAIFALRYRGQTYGFMSKQDVNREELWCGEENDGRTNPYVCDDFPIQPRYPCDLFDCDQTIMEKGMINLADGDRFQYRHADSLNSAVPKTRLREMQEGYTLGIRETIERPLRPTALFSVQEGETIYHFQSCDGSNQLADDYCIELVYPCLVE